MSRPKGSLQTERPITRNVRVNTGMTTLILTAEKLLPRLWFSKSMQKSMVKVIGSKCWYPRKGVFTKISKL